MRSLLLKQIQAEQLKRKCKDDLTLFADTFLSHVLKCKTPEFHREIYELLKTETRLALAAPRSFAKSTITDVIYTLHCLLYGTREDILIISNSGALADEWVRKVKLELELNEKIKEVFGEQQSEKWTQDHIILRNGNQLRAKGRGYQIRGFRPTKVILDDLEDDEMVRSKEQRDKLGEWFLGALLNTLEPNQQLIYIGTLLHPLSLLKRIVCGDDPMFNSWTKRLFKAIVRGQNSEIQSIWPEKWPLEELLKRQAEIGTHKFEAEFMNNPIADSTVVFHPDTYKYYETIPEDDKIESIVTGFDLIGSTKEFETKDYIAFITLAKTQSKKIYCVDARAGHWNQDELLEQFFSINKDFKPQVFIGEETSFQQIVAEYLIKEARRQDIYLPIQGVKLGSYTENDPLRKAKDKVSRALTVQHIFTQGLFYLKRNQRTFYEELSTFPASDYDDQVDAMVHALHVLTDRVKMEVIGSSNPLNLSEPMTNIMPSKRFENLFKKQGLILD